MLLLSWGVGPWLAAAAVILALAYISDQFSLLLQRPDWRLQFAALAAVLMILAESSQLAAITRLLHPGATGVRAALKSAFSRRAGSVLWGCLIAVGILQAVAGVAPIGDDIWHYTAAADALIGGQGYPISTVGQEYQDAGMTENYPALPVLPMLLAVSFSLFGRNLVGVAVPLVVSTALFPLILYAACKSMTGSRSFAYIATLLLFLFPIYQIHILGSPEPDTIFVTLLLIGALLAVKARGDSRRMVWGALGVTMGLASLTRPEGIAYSSVLFLTFLAVHQRSVGYWISAAAYLVILAPFALLHFSITGSLWPTTFAGTINWQNAGMNLAMLEQTALSWYAQGIGIDTSLLVTLLAAACLGSLLGAVALGRHAPALLFIPLAGIGNMVAGFFIHPQVMLTYSPVEFLRHVSFGIPFVALTLGYGAYSGYRCLVGMLPTHSRSLLVVVIVMLVSAAVHSESARLAKPEPYFGGPSSLLWTGSSYLLVDLASSPQALPAPDDLRTGEQLRQDLQQPLEEVNLRGVNRSEPYHWSTLILALFGLFYCLFASSAKAAGASNAERKPCPLMVALVRDLAMLLAVLPCLALTTALLKVAHLISRVRALLRDGSTPVPKGSATATIVVATRNDGGLLEECLQSVKGGIRLEGAEPEVIVVGSGTSTAREMVTRVLPQARFLIAQGEDLESRWRIGLESARHEVVVLLDGQRVVDRDFLSSLVSCFDDSQVFAVSPRCNPDGEETATHRTGKTRGEIRNGEIRLWHAPWTGVEMEEQSILWATRGFSAYRKGMLLELGGFDPLFASAEFGDADLCFRAWKRGWGVALETRSVVRRATSSDPEVERLSPDLLEMDRILFAWRNLTNVNRLLQYQLSLAARLCSDAGRGQLNLRPLRLALARSPRLIRRVMAPSALSELSEEEVFRISSHRYYLKEHKAEDTLPRPPGFGDQGTGEAAPSVDPQPLPPSPQLPELSTRALRILMVCPQLPYPPTHGSAVRMWNLLKTLANRHHVDLLSFSEPNLSTDEVATSVQELQQHCGLVRTIVRQPVSSHSSIFDRTIHVEMFDCLEMRETLLDMVDRGRYDVIQFEKTEMGQYVLPQRAPVQLLTEHIVFYHAYRRQFLSRGHLTAAHLIDYLKLRRYESKTCGSFDGVITMSAVDTKFLRSRLPSHPWIVEIPNGVDTDYYHFAMKSAERNNLLFIGNFDHSPNVDGIRFFLKEVFPRVKAEIPEVRQLVVGPGPFHSIQEIASEPAVLPLGLVPDTRPYMASCAVFVAPILAGSGTRLKILEAMSAGIPVVSTTIGAEGLDVKSGTHLLIADEPEAFAKDVITLLRSAELRQRLRICARRKVEDRYDWVTIAEGLEKVYREMVWSAGTWLER